MKSADMKNSGQTCCCRDELSGFIIVRGPPEHKIEARKALENMSEKAEKRFLPGKRAS